MANHALPTTSSLYTDVLTNLKDRIDDSLKMLDSVNTSPTNVPTNAVRWNSTSNIWEKYNGSSWISLAASYAIQVLKSSNLVGGNSTTLLGSIPYQSNTDTTSLLSPNTTTTRKFLRQTGTGTNGAAPAWDTLLAADIPVLDTSKITTGILPVSRGGTGVTTSTGTGSVVLSASPTFTGTVTAPTFSGALTGNAATATKLATARTIGGVSFDGTANINLPGVNTTGNQNTTGNAATATNATQLGGNLPSYYQSALGFKPVQQGTGIGQSGNAIKIGWSSVNRVKVTVDSTDMGNIVMDSNIGVANSSLVKTALNASGTAPIYACRAWVNFNGTGTVAIRASGNVSSITDNGVGNYTVNFTTAMPDANFACVAMGSRNSGATNYNPTPNAIAYAPSSIQLRCHDQNSDSATDALYLNVAIFR